MTLQRLACSPPRSGTGCSTSCRTTRCRGELDRVIIAGSPIITDSALRPRRRPPRASRPLKSCRAPPLAWTSLENAGLRSTAPRCVWDETSHGTADMERGMREAGKPSTSTRSAPAEERPRVSPGQLGKSDGQGVLAAGPVQEAALASPLHPAPAAVALPDGVRQSVEVTEACNSVSSKRKPERRPDCADADGCGRPPRRTLTPLASRRHLAGCRSSGQPHRWPRPFSYSRVCVPACARLASWSRLRAGSPATHRPLGAACGQVGEVATVRPGPRVLAANLRLIRQGCWQGPFSRRART